MASSILGTHDDPPFLDCVNIVHNISAAATPEVHLKWGAEDFNQRRAKSGNKCHQGLPTGLGLQIRDQDRRRRAASREPVPDFAALNPGYPCYTCCMKTASTPCVISVSEWRLAPFRVDGETVFAIGDVHGCADQLSALLETFSKLARDATATRLIFLGDLICRGPSSLAALAKWSARDLDATFGKVHRLSGNHEQLLMLSIGGSEIAESAKSKWMSIDGDSFVDEMRRKLARPDAPLTRESVADAVGETVMDRLDNLERHVRLGNVIFVHGGIDPAVDADTSLAMPWNVFGGNHWAWIQQPFLAWRGGFGGSIVVHGHTPPAKHRMMSGCADPHVLAYDRLSLDGGSAATGIVAAAQIQDGRYRVVTSSPSIS
jgi:serine/threonine protein phosphatase 1